MARERLGHVNKAVGTVSAGNGKKGMSQVHSFYILTGNPLPRVVPASVLAGFTLVRSGMFISGCEELSLEERGGWQRNLTVLLPDGSLLPFLLPSLPSSPPELMVSKHLRGGSTPTWGLVSLQEHSRRVSSASGRAGSTSLSLGQQ